MNVKRRIFFSFDKIVFDVFNSIAFVGLSTLLYINTKRAMKYDVRTITFITLT